MIITISKKQHWTCQIFFAAVSVALVIGGLLLYVCEEFRLDMYVYIYWAALLLSLFFIPRNWLAKNVLPAIRAWWGLERAETRRLFLTASAATLISSIIAHGFLFSNEFFSHDSLYTFPSDHVLTPHSTSFFYYAHSGRFFFNPYEGLRGHTTYAPWLIGMLFILWMVLCTVLLARLLKIESTSGIILASCLLCTSTTLTATGATYIYCLDIFTLSLTFAVAAVWFFQQRVDLLGTMCVVLSLGLYQAYFSTALVLAFFCVIQMISKSRPISEVVRQGVRYLAMLFIGFGLYYAIWSAGCAFAQVEKARVSESLFGTGLSNLLPLLKDAWLQYFSQYLLNGRETLGVLYPVASILIVLAVVYWSLGCFLNKDMPLSNKGLLLLALLFMPLALNISKIFFPGNNSDLVNFQTGLLFIFLVCCREHPPELHTSPRQYRAAVLALLCLICWRNVIFSNQAYLKKEVVKSSTISLVTRMISRVEAVDGYQPNETPVLFYPDGYFDAAPNLVMSADPYRFKEINSHTGLDVSLSADNTSYLRIYIQYYLNYPMAVVTDYSKLSDAELTEIEAMPAFPAEGAVAFVGEYVVVKLQS